MTLDMCLPTIAPDKSNAADRPDHGKRPNRLPDTPHELDSPATEPEEPSEPEELDLPHDNDDAHWEVFIPDDDECDPWPEPGDFWIEFDCASGAAA